MKSLSSRRCFLAVDIGATSGREVLCLIQDGGRLEFHEIHRFPNRILDISGKYYWDIYALYASVVEGLRKCAAEGYCPESIGIDTWGVDFGFVGEEGVILGLPRAYRDSYTDGAPEEFYDIVPKEALYNKTGIQIMPFNTIFQMFRQTGAGFSPMMHASRLLFIPDLIAYMLTGRMVCEYTVASTSQLLDPYAKDFDSSLLAAAGVRRDMFPEIVMPGTVIGELTDSLAGITGLGKVKVVAVAGHDTASAVAAVPAEGRNFAYLSSGTWSLMGIETDSPVINDETNRLNITNEGGVDGTVRLLKNITGMWLLENCMKEWKAAGREYSYTQIVEMAGTSPSFRSLIDPDHRYFANPESMTGAIARYCKETGQPVPASDSGFISCIFESLAMKYRTVLGWLQGFAGNEISVLHIIGGGARNSLLNGYTANATGKKVVAGPFEATAIGNIMMQARAAGLCNSLEEMRKLTFDSIETETFHPSDTEAWDNAYGKFLEIINGKQIQTT